MLETVVWVFAGFRSLNPFSVFTQSSAFTTTASELSVVSVVTDGVSSGCDVTSLPAENTSSV